MMKRILTIIFLLLLLVQTADVFAAKKPPVGDKKQQEAFTQEYFDMKAKGGKEFSDWKSAIANGSSDEQANMLSNLEGNKTAGGKEKTKKELEADEQRLKDAKKAQGFMGDPTDPGPKDWSDWNIETDANGNVTGFKEKDFEEKDADGDGEISDEERAEWDKKKKKEHDEAGGPPGDVDITPDWDKDNDGIPDPGFERDCWKCVMPELLDECVDGAPGPCDGHACSHDEECREHTETHRQKSYLCHTCAPKEEIVKFCENYGFSSDPACGGKCPAIACVPLDVDKKDGKVVPTNQTRERGSTERCYTCMKITSIEVTYIVIIIETPFERFILKDMPGFEGFIPSQVMALAKVEQGPGGIKQLAGLMPGSAGSAMGFLNMAQSMNLESFSNMLTQGLDKGNRYGGDCFEKDFDAADMSSGAQPPASAAPTEKKKRGKNEPPEPEPAAPGDFGKDPRQAVAPSGPILACGQQGKEKALAVMDAAGRPVDMITREELKRNPDAVRQAMQKAQSLSDTVMGIRQQGIQGFMVRRAQAMAQGFVDKWTKKAVDSVSERLKDNQENSKKKKKKKRKKGEPPEQIVPNDPYYPLSAAPKKSRTADIVLGSTIKMGGRHLGVSDEDEEEAVKYQWGLHAVGFTPLENEDSAWNFVDKDKKNVVVAVIDSGMDFAHPDAPQYIWNNEDEIPDNGIDDDLNGYVDDVRGWNFLDNNNDLTDLQGHGSFVAGIIAAKWNNGIGIAGINPGAVIMPIKTADAEGKTSSFHIFRAIHYAVDNGAKIINISLGSRGISDLERTALNYAAQMGVFVAVAGGNVGENISGHGPASSKGAFAVGALDMEGTRSAISNWGPNNGLLAPGDKIVSLIAGGTGKKLRKSVLKDGYYAQSGTSFSTPIVAATASLLLAQKPDLTPAEIEDILHRSADDMFEPGWDGSSGAGVLNASAALQHIAQRPVTLKITETRFNLKDKKVESVDVFGTVRGPVKSYLVEVGKGKNAGRFTTVAGPYTKAADHDWLTKIDVKTSLRGSKEWTLRIRGTDEQGQEHVAELLLELK